MQTRIPSQRPCSHVSVSALFAKIVHNFRRVNLYLRRNVVGFYPCHNGGYQVWPSPHGNKNIWFPKTSKHVLVSHVTMSLYYNEPSNKESKVSHEQTSMLKALGSSRISHYQIETIMITMYPSLSMSIPSIDRLCQKGIREHIGCNDDVTTVQFLEVVVKWKAAGG